MKRTEIMVIWAFFIAGWINFSYAQSQPSRIGESELKNTYGLDKLKALNYFTDKYTNGGHRKGIRYGKQAVVLAENLFLSNNTLVDKGEEFYLLQAYFQYGKALFNKEDYFDAREYLYKARALSLSIDTLIFQSEISNHLDKIQDLISTGKIKEGLFSKTLGNVKIGRAVNNVSSDLRIQAEIKLGKKKEAKKDFRGAIDHYKKSIDLLTNQGDATQITELNLKIASLLDSLNQPHEMQLHLAEAIETIQSLPIRIDSSIYVSNQEQSSESPHIATANIKKIQEERNSLKSLAESFERKKNFKKSLEYYKLYESLSAKIERDSLVLENERKSRASEIKLLRQQKLLADKDVIAAELGQERHLRHRNLILAASMLLLFLALTALYHYLTKRSQHLKLTEAYKDLDFAKDKLERAEKKIRNLLKQQVSGDIATELITQDEKNIGARHFVCIMFLDIRDFTPLAEKLSPEKLIAYQNGIFGFMMDIEQKNHGNINQLLGDGFMATFGAPISHGNDCANAFSAAKEIVAEVNNRNQTTTFQHTRIGIGLHAGHVVTGNVGNESRKQYSITGNPVIIASRIEQLNKTYNSSLIISESVVEKLSIGMLNHQELEYKAAKVKGRAENINIIVVE